MKFFEKLRAVFAKTGLVDKAKSNSMTAADWAAVREAYKKEYGVDLSQDHDAYVAEQNQQQQAQQLAQENDAIRQLIGQAFNELQNESDNASGVNTSSSISLEYQTRALIDALHTISSQVIPDNAPSVGGVTLSVNGPGNTPEYFCGIEHPLFSMDRRYNKIACNPAYATMNPASEKVDGTEFRTHLGKYSDFLANRINQLRANNSLNPTSIRSNFNLSVGSDGLGDQYLTRRTDEIIVRLLSIKNVYDIFPRRFGVQDREVMYNAFMGEFSQAYQEGSIWKGNIDLEPEMAYVDDAMFKTLFGSMKDLERKYIGYLNKDGSDPIKWTMIEWVMLQISTKLIEEQNRRKILGIYVKPEKGTAGNYMNAGTGVYYTLLRYYNEGKIALVDDAAYAGYTSGETMVACVVNMLQMLATNIDDLDSYEVILNANHRAMWLAGIRETYGKDTDFRGPNGDEVPDLRNVIRWCPYMGQLPLIIVQKPGNIQSVEFLAGEMHAIQFDTDMEAVKAWSTWKEGTSAEFSGKMAKNKAAKKAAGFTEQVIFMNRPSVALDADATTVSVKGDYRHYVTGVNTSEQSLTDIVGAKAGIAYLIEIGDATHPQSIAKSDKFSEITEAYTPTQVGDYIMVILNAAGDKFLELERCVGGVRKVNTALQPNVPGGR
jgi:hypothetical protein